MPDQWIVKEYVMLKTVIATLAVSVATIGAGAGIACASTPAGHGLTAFTAAAQPISAPVDPGTANAEVIGSGLAGAVPGALTGAAIGGIAGGVIACGTTVLACPISVWPGIAIGASVGGVIGGAATGIPSALGTQAVLG